MQSSFNSTWEHPGWFNNQNFEGKLRDVFFLSSAQTYYKHEAFSKKGAKCVFSSFFPTPPLSTAFDTCRLGQVGWGDHRWELASLLSGLGESSQSLLSQALCVGLSEAPLAAAPSYWSSPETGNTFPSGSLLPPRAAWGHLWLLAAEACESPNKPLRDPEMPTSQLSSYLSFHHSLPGQPEVTHWHFTPDDSEMQAAQNNHISLANTSAVSQPVSHP